MNLYFEEGWMPDDLCGYRYLPDWWNATEKEDNEFLIHFEACDNRDPLSTYEEELLAEGFGYVCFVSLERETEYGDFSVWEIARFPARDKEDAERLLNLAADALYGEETR